MYASARRNVARSQREMLQYRLRSTVPVRRLRTALSTGVHAAPERSARTNRPNPNPSVKIGSERQSRVPLPGTLSRDSAASSGNRLGPHSGSHTRPQGADAKSERGSFVPELHRLDHPSPRASAPLVMSRISIVMAFWRSRLYVMRRSSRRSSALDVALSIATIRAPCSAALDSSSARQT